MLLLNGRTKVPRTALISAAPDEPGVQKRTTFTRGKTQMKALMNRFVKDDAGQDLIEYGLLIGIITAAVVGSITAIGGKVQGFYSSLQQNIGA